MPPRGARGGGRRGRGRVNRRRAEDREARDEASHHDENPSGDEQGVDNPGANNPNLNPTQLMADFMAALTATLNQNRPAATDRTLEIAREFKRMSPPTFDGKSGDPLDADHWLAEMRKCFTVLKVTDESQMVALVARQLLGEPNKWWESVLALRKDARRADRAARNVVEPDVENITWAEFEAMFEKQYFPESFKEQLREEFERLEQGTCVYPTML